MAEAFIFEEQFCVGENVRFLGVSEGQKHWGGPYADEAVLVVGDVYWISRVEPHTWHTKVWLGEGDLGPFNSVCFGRGSGPQK